MFVTRDGMMDSMKATLRFVAGLASAGGVWLRAESVTTSLPPLLYKGDHHIFTHLANKQYLSLMDIILNEMNTSHLML